MSGKSAMLSTLIIDRRLCVACLAAETAMAVEAVETALQVLGRALLLRRYPDKPCDGCGDRTSVFMVDSH